MAELVKQLAGDVENIFEKKERIKKWRTVEEEDPYDKYETILLYSVEGILLVVTSKHERYVGIGYMDNKTGLIIDLEPELYWRPI